MWGTDLLMFPLYTGLIIPLKIQALAFATQKGGAFDSAWLTQNGSLSPTSPIYFIQWPLILAVLPNSQNNLFFRCLLLAHRWMNWCEPASTRLLPHSLAGLTASARLLPHSLADLLGSTRFLPHTLCLAHVFKTRETQSW